MVEIKKLVKTFKTPAGDFVALKNLSFRVPSGQFLAITGRSGSGKSTLLYQMSLLDHPTEGSITINGEETVNLSKEERTLFRLNNMGYVFQDYALLPTLTAEENVAMPLLMQGVARTEALQKARESLSEVGLAEKTAVIPSRLSGGQQQRVSIARALVSRPKLIFADEPTANLDSESSDVVIKLFEKLNKAGLTIIMVTHELEYAKHADRNIVLSDGKIEKDTLIQKKNR